MGLRLAEARDAGCAPALWHGRPHGGTSGKDCLGTESGLFLVRGARWRVECAGPDPRRDRLACGRSRNGPRRAGRTGAGPRVTTPAKPACPRDRAPCRHPHTTLVRRYRRLSSPDPLPAEHDGNMANFLILPQRYDGVDLPDDACRVLMLDGIPPTGESITRITSITRGRPDLRFETPVVLSGDQSTVPTKDRVRVTIEQTSASIRVPNALPFTANRRRWSSFSRTLLFPNFSRRTRFSSFRKSMTSSCR